jgi:hypothetical protein
MNPTPESGRAVARAVRDAVGGEPVVEYFLDQPEKNSVYIVHFDDRPVPGYATYSTLSLHLAPNYLEGDDIRVEVAGVAPSIATGFPSLLSTVAFFVTKDHWLCAPGVVFPGLIPRYCPGLSSTLEHVVFTEPFPWEQLSTVKVSDELSVHWLLAIPISEAERQFLLEHGYDKFEELFDTGHVPYFDLERPSVV